MSTSQNQLNINNKNKNELGYQKAEKDWSQIELLLAEKGNKLM